MITPEALDERGFYFESKDEDGKYYVIRNITWRHFIKVSFFFNNETLVELCLYDPFIPAFGCKTMEDIDQLIKLFIA